MLVKITTQCQMQCSHCMEDPDLAGEFMSLKVFDRALRFIQEVYQGVKIIMVSGGEPTEHPEIFSILDRLKGWKAILLSNGLFLRNEEMAEKILAYDIGVQIYNDPRYYPIKVEPKPHPKILFATAINKLSPFGRAKNMSHERYGPMCFNLRSHVWYYKELPAAIMGLRTRGKICTPSIDVHGNVIAGECRFCHKIGTVDSKFQDIAENIMIMKCNRCGLENDLSPACRQAIGLI